jgi:hypothetical protein
MTIDIAKIKKIKNLWIRWGILAAMSFAASAAFGNAFSGPNPDTQNLTWGGFSNGSVGVNVSTNFGVSYSGVNAGQFYGLFDGEGNGLGPDDFFRFFCIELGQFVDSAPNSLYAELRRGWRAQRDRRRRVDPAIRHVLPE